MPGVKYIIPWNEREGGKGGREKVSKLTKNDVGAEGVHKNNISVNLLYAKKIGSFTIFQWKIIKKRIISVDIFR